MTRKHVLIVDDHAMARDALRTIVNRYSNLRVIGEAVNGLEAIRAVGELKPDLVLMDITMPVINGIQATAEIKRRYPDVRVLMVTLHSGEEYYRASMEAAADGYVVKHATPEEFAVAIRNALGAPVQRIALAT